MSLRVLLWTDLGEKREGIVNRMASAFIPGFAAVPCDLAALRRAAGFTDIPCRCGLIVQCGLRGRPASVQETLPGVSGRGHAPQRNLGAPTLPSAGGGTPVRGSGGSQYPPAS